LLIYVVNDSPKETGWEFSCRNLTTVVDLTFEHKLRNNCIVFDELPASIGNLTIANAVLLGMT
jgi:hypothetical protein